MHWENQYLKMTPDKKWNKQSEEQYGKAFRDREGQKSVTRLCAANFQLGLFIDENKSEKWRVYGHVTFNVSFGGMIWTDGASVLLSTNTFADKQSVAIDM